MSLGWSLGRWFVLTLLNLLRRLLDYFIGKSAFVRILLALWHPELNSSMLMNGHNLLWRMNLLYSSNTANANFLLCGCFLCNSFTAVSLSGTISPSFPTVSHGFPLSWNDSKVLKISLISLSTALSEFSCFFIFSSFPLDYSQFSQWCFWHSYNPTFRVVSWCF